MNKERFEELSEALRQAKAVRRGEAAPSRVWSVKRAARMDKFTAAGLIRKSISTGKRRNGKTPCPPRELRLRLSQIKFAELLGISVKTNCTTGEQGRREADEARRAGAVARGVAASRSDFGGSNGMKWPCLLEN